MPEVKPQIETFAKIKVVGVGGSGNSIVNRMVKSGIRGVDFWVMNTDVQALHNNEAENKLHIGKKVTRGLGSGMDPEIGKESAKEAEDEIRDALEDTDMVFVTCGLGGGTGSGASPVIAEIAQDMDILTVGVVTKPFSWEGPQRMKIAESANDKLADHVDTIITIPNDKILKVIDKKTSLVDAFEVVDDVLRQGVQGISELITVPGLVNVDFADVKTIMKNQGSALMGIGTAEGKSRAVEAAQKAVSSPMLELTIDGAEGILFSITGGEDLSMQEVSEAAKIITNSAGEDAQVIFGAVIDEDMGDEVRINVIATGFGDDENEDSGGNSRSRKKSSRFSRNNKTNNNGSKNKNEKKSNKNNNSFVGGKEEKSGAKEKQTSSEGPSFTKKEVKKDNKSGTKNAETNTSSTGSESVNEKQRIKEKRKQQSPQSGQGKNEDDEDDLEIPAFIRKKMGM